MKEALTLHTLQLGWWQGAFKLDHSCILKQVIISTAITSLKAQNWQISKPQKIEILTEREMYAHARTHKDIYIYVYKYVPIYTHVRMYI